ncbi:unnamed protein product, partial [Heterotrigona itama]
ANVVKSNINVCNVSSNERKQSTKRRKKIKKEAKDKI